MDKADAGLLAARRKSVQHDIHYHPSGPSQSDYAQRVRRLSDRLVAAQKPIRILDAVKWDEAVERDFFARRAEELPAVTAEWYERRPLPFDPDKKISEFSDLARDIQTQLGDDDAPGCVMRRMCLEYCEVVELLRQRGTREFVVLSRRLFGSTTERLDEHGTTLTDVALSLNPLLMSLGHHEVSVADQQIFDAPATVAVLALRLKNYFRSEVDVKVKLSDGILADAAAGSDYIKIRGEACFTGRQVRLLEVHEGWVHLGTTLNGQSQPVCTFLSKGTPAATVTQEGLAVLTELLTATSHPERIRRLSNRIRGIALAEAGADFLEVYHFFEEEGHLPRECYQQTVRIFRGSLPTGCGPFTKDLCYGRGFFHLLQYLRETFERGRLDRIPLLFCGKTSLHDIALLEPLVEAGLVMLPRFVPPPFEDLQALSAWICQASHRPLRERVGFPLPVA